MSQLSRFDALIREVIAANPYTEYGYRPQTLGHEEERATKHARMLMGELATKIAAASEKPAHVPGRSLPPKPFPGIVKEWLDQWGDIAPMRTADLWDRIVAMQEET